MNTPSPSPLVSDADVTAACQAALAELRPPAAQAAAWGERLSPILAHNIAVRRFDLACTYQPAATSARQALFSYARRVLAGLLAESERLDRLRAGESTAWAAVIDRLERLAYHWYGAAGREAWALWEARDAAAGTCADLWQWLQAHPFPFDVPFNRWAARALTYRLNDGARRQKHRAPAPVESLDRPCAPGAEESCAEQPADARSAAVYQRIGEREALLQAIGRLDARHGRVVRLGYFEQVRADEIAAHLGERVGNVYVLRHRALKKLRRHYQWIIAPERAVKENGMDAPSTLSGPAARSGAGRGRRGKHLSGRAGLKGCAALHDSVTAMLEYDPAPHTDL